MTLFEQNLLDLLLPSEEKIEIFLSSRGIKGAQIVIPDYYAMQLVRELLPKLGLQFKLVSIRNGWKIYLTKHKEDLKLVDLFSSKKEGYEAKRKFYEIPSCCVDDFGHKKPFIYLKEFPFVSHIPCSYLCSETRSMNNRIRREIFKEYGEPGIVADLLDKFGNRFDWWPYKIIRLFHEQGIRGKLTHRLEVEKSNPEPVYGRHIWALERRNETIVYSAFLRKTGVRNFGDRGRPFRCIYDTIEVIEKKSEYVEPLSQVPFIRV